MFRYVIAALCGMSLTGSVYMAGWGEPRPTVMADDCCEVPAEATKTVSLTLPEGVVDMKNSKCVVMGEDIGTSTKYVVADGKAYHICCGDCDATFKKETEKYVKAFNADPAKFGVK